MKINVENDEMLGRTIEKELYFELFNRLKSKDKEIERLQNIIDKNKYTADELNEIERLHSIIKEVREYIENAFATGEEIFKVEILEILDKENK